MVSETPDMKHFLPTVITFKAAATAHVRLSFGDACHTVGNAPSTNDIPGFSSVGSNYEKRDGADTLTT
jgi:hypothetical protein